MAKDSKDGEDGMGLRRESKMISKQEIQQVLLNIAHVRYRGLCSSMLDLVKQKKKNISRKPNTEDGVSRGVHDPLSHLEGAAGIPESGERGDAGTVLYLLQLKDAA